MPSELSRSNKDLSRGQTLPRGRPRGSGEESGDHARYTFISQSFSPSVRQEFYRLEAINQAQLRVTDASSLLPIGPLAFSIRNTMRLSLRSVISTLSPVSRMRLGMSITDSGSVHSTSSRSPAESDFSALRVFSAGNGHFRPARSSFVVVMRSGWRRELASSTRSIGQARPGKKADDLAGRDLRDVLAEFGKAVGVGERGQEACALAREFDRLDRTVTALAQGHADIFPAGNLLLV